MRKLKILRVIASLDRADGGPPAFVHNSSRILAERGHLVDIATVDCADKSNVYASNSYIHRALGPIDGPFKRSSKFNKWINSNIIKYDVLTTHGLWLNPISTAARFAKNNRIPYFMFIHGAMLPWHRKNIIKHRAKQLYTLFTERENLNSADKILVTSEPEFSDVKMWRPRLRGDNIAQIKYGAHFESNGASGASRSRAYFLYLGRVTKQKNISLLLDTYKAYVRQGGELGLKVAGPIEENLKSEISAKVGEINPNNIDLLDRYIQDEEKTQLFNGAKAFVLPSRGENFSIVTAEALAAGVPPIISPQVALAKVVAGAAAGFVSEANRGSILSAMLAIDRMPAPEYISMCRRAEVLFKRELSLTATVDHLEEMMLLCASSGVGLQTEK